MYLFPALTWPISFAGNPQFNSVYVRYQQYWTFYTGATLSLAVIGMFIASYVQYEADASLTQSQVLRETIGYSIGSVIGIAILAVKNKDFQRFYQQIYSSSIFDFVDF